MLGIVSAVVAALIIFYRNRAKEAAEKAAMALILGGTLSNLIDRIFRGAVMDYIIISDFPAFNIADAALTAGAALIITAVLLQKFRR